MPKVLAAFSQQFRETFSPQRNVGRRRYRQRDIRRERSNVGNDSTDISARRPWITVDNEKPLALDTTDDHDDFGPYRGHVLYYVRLKAEISVETRGWRNLPIAFVRSHLRDKGREVS